MHFHFRNVNDAFHTLVSDVHKGKIPTRRSPSRVGEVLMVGEPVIVTYTHPCERVLFNPLRDCNPFFHLFEALWTLAGRNDVAPLIYYNPRMSEFSDDGKTLHGAYGYRWRKRFGWDQLEGIVRELKDFPDSRRCVLSVWNSCFHDDDRASSEEDMEMVLTGSAKDVPCNTHAYFALRPTIIGDPGEPDASVLVLDMTVCNRSNDLVWGMLGANVVHWSILQEYMARRIGVGMGLYHQFSNNLHVYTERWEPEKWLEWHEEDKPGYSLITTYPLPLVEDPQRFDNEVKRFIDSIDGDFEEPFLCNVAQPMMAAFRAHKQRRYVGDNSAFHLIDRVWADDWKITGRRWIERRHMQWKDRIDRNPYLARELPRQEAASRPDKD